MITKTKGCSANQLKIFALICMTLDHVGYLLLPQYTVLRYIGRLAMPIFAWMIAEGCRYTKNRLRYLLLIAGVAAVCQAVYWVTSHSLMQCILVTFTLSILLIYGLDHAVKKKSLFSILVLAALFGAIAWLCIFLPQRLPKFQVDYGFFGVILPVAVYMGRSKAEKLFAAACCLAAIAVNYAPMQWFAFAALPILYLYDGRRGKYKLKYLFYLYYPLHLAAIYGIAYLMKIV